MNYRKPEVVTLILRDRDPKVKTQIHCINCGWRLHDTYQKVVIIVQGIAEPTQIRTEILCPRCKAIYEIC